MNRGRALIVEDDVAIRELLRLHLSIAGFDITELGDGARALEVARSTPFDLIVLDIMLPGVDGITLCRAIRSDGPNTGTGILMLTARDAESDKVLGLESGAGSCFGFQVGRCNGACVGKEPAALHLTRVKMALIGHRLEPWPHAGPMMVREGSGARAQYHVIDTWQHLGTVESGIDVSEADELWRVSTRTRRGSFDIDSYRILTRMLREPRYKPLPLPPA